MRTQHPRFALRRALRGRQLSYRRAAAILSAPFASLHQITKGKFPPDLRLAVAIEREFGIPVEDWPSLRQPVQDLLRLRGVA